MNPNWFYSIQLILRRSQWQQPRVEGEARDKVCPASVKWINQPKPSQERVKGTSGSSPGQRGKPGTKAALQVGNESISQNPSRRGWKEPAAAAQGRGGIPGQRPGNGEMNQSAKTLPGEGERNQWQQPRAEREARDKGPARGEMNESAKIVPGEGERNQWQQPRTEGKPGRKGRQLRNESISQNP